MPTSRSPSTTRQSMRPAPTLGATHAALLEALLRFHFLTADLSIRALALSPASISFVRGALKILHDVGLVEQVYLGRQGPAGSSKKVYTLFGRGLAYLRRQGFEVWPRYHAGEQADVGIWHLRHTLAVVSTLIAAELVCRRIPDLSLERLLPERAVRRDLKAKVPVLEADGRRRDMTIWNDAYLEFRFHDRIMPVALELDRGTETRPVFQEKVKALLAYAAGPFQAAARRRALTIAVLTPHSEKRRRDLTGWTAAACTAQDQEAFGAGLFRFAYADPDTINPADLYLAPIWFAPFDPTPVPLLGALLELSP